MSVVPIPFPDKALIFIQVSTFSSGGPVLKGTEPHSQLWDVSCLLGTTRGNPTALPLNGLGPQASALPQGLQGTSHMASLLTSDDLQMTESTQVLLALLCWLLPDSVNLT